MPSRRSRNAASTSSCSVASARSVSPRARLSSWQRLGGVDVSRPTERADLLGDGIHPGPDVVTLLGDRTQPRIEIGGVAHVVEQSGAVTATERFLDHRQVGAQESLVDHDVAGYLSAIIPVRPVPRRSHSPMSEPTDRWAPGSSLERSQSFR